MNDKDMSGPNLNTITLAITGGTGFVGKTVIRLALDQGYHVRALTRRAQDPREGVTWVQGALDNGAALETLAKGADAIIHIAGVVNAPDKAGFEAGNVAGTLTMVEAAKAAGVERFVHVSSLSAREPQLSDYGASKARGETVVQASSLNWTIVRPPAIYGPADTEIFEMFKMAAKGVVLLPPGGRMSAIEVSDLAHLLLALATEREETTGAIFEVDDGHPGGWLHQDFAAALGKAVGRRVTTLSVPRWALNWGARGDRLVRRGAAKLTQDRVAYFCHPDWVVDPAKRPPTSLWEPKIGTEAGLKATADWYKAEGWMK